MKSPVFIVVQSHLSDAQALMSVGELKSANQHINFSKHLINLFTEDMNQYVSHKELDEIWNNLFNN